MKKKTFIPDWMLERYALGELPARTQQPRRRLAGPAVLSGRWWRLLTPRAVKPEQLRLLEKSYILNDELRYERFFLLLSDTPIKTGRILAHLNRLATHGGRFASLARIPGLAMKQLSLLLHKETP